MIRWALLFFVSFSFSASAFTDASLSKWLQIRSFPFHNNAQNAPLFKEEISKKNFNTQQLIEKLSAGISRGEATRDFFSEFAFAETLDCGGACFSIVPFSTDVSWIEVSLCRESLESVCQVTLHSYDGKPLISKADIERAFGSSGDCLSFAMDTNLLICPLSRMVSGTAADVTVFWAKRPKVPDEPINEIHLRIKSHAPPAEPEQTQQRLQPDNIQQIEQARQAVQAAQQVPVKPPEYAPFSTPTTKLYFVGLLLYLTVPLYFFYKWRNRRLKNKKHVTNPIISGILGLTLNLSISYYGTKMWAEGKQFYDMGGIALIFVFLFIFIIAVPVSAIVTQLILDIRAK